MNAAARRGALLATLAVHEPVGDREAGSLERARAFVRDLPDPFDGDGAPIHVTASAIVTDGRGNVLLHRHRILGIWLQPGGHLEPAERTEDAALREVLEETGIAAEHPATGPRLLHVDVHPGPRARCDLHLDLRYLLHAPLGAAPRPGRGESRDVAWFTLEDAAAASDASVADALRKLTS